MTERRCWLHDLRPKILIPKGSPGTFHFVSRFVRRAWLCGEDRESGRSYEHRRQWVEDRIGELAEIFAVAVWGYAVMSNHLHVVVEVMPQVAPVGLPLRSRCAGAACTPARIRMRPRGPRCWLATPSELMFCGHASVNCRGSCVASLSRSPGGPIAKTVARDTSGSVRRRA